MAMRPFNGLWKTGGQVIHLQPGPGGMPFLRPARPAPVPLGHASALNIPPARPALITVHPGDLVWPDARPYHGTIGELLVPTFQ